MYPQGVCRIRKPAYADNGCAIFPVFGTVERTEKDPLTAADDLFRGSLVLTILQKTQFFRRLLYRRCMNISTNRNSRDTPTSTTYPSSGKIGGEIIKLHQSRCFHIIALREHSTNEY